MDKTLLIKAIEHYDATMQYREEVLKNVDSINSLEEYVSLMIESLEAVQFAYWQVTKGINSQYNCKLVTIEDARMLLKDPVSIPVVKVPI